MTRAKKDKKDPLETAALLKLSFRLGATEQSPGTRLVYEGVLRDLGVKDEDVERYLRAHFDALVKTARGKERGEP